MSSMVIVVTNTILYTWKLLREQILNVSPQKKEMVIMWHVGGISKHYDSNHFSIYKCLKSTYI